MVVITISWRNEFSTYSSGFPCFGNFHKPVKGEIEGALGFV